MKKKSTSRKISKQDIWELLGLTEKIKAHNVITTEAFNNKRKLFCSNMNLEMRKGLMKCCVESTSYECETRTMEWKDSNK